MLSMCGLLCRMLRGWRHNEAIMLMAQTLSQSQVSLMVQEVSTITEGGGIEVREPNSSSFCQNSNESNTEQLLWKDNNKHACCVTPKQQVDLQRWTLFLTTDSPSSDPAACANGNSPDGLVDSQNETSITVLLEAAFREDTDRNVQDYHILVEQLAIPYAWKAREKFGIIVYTNPAKLLAMIQAFFNNALIIDDDFIIKKILTIDVSGVPSTLDDPLSIPECVTPRPYSNASQKRAMTAMELARCLSPAPPSRSITPSPLPPQVTHGMRGTEMASSNPNLHFTNSPFKRGIPTSNSFTNSPFRRPHSSAAEFSPTKRGFASSGPPSNTDDGCSTPMGLGPVKEEELTRRNCDSVTEKPPNILIYSSNKEDYFLVIKETLSRCINEDRYIMYQLTDEMAFKSPWSGNTTLLVVCGDVPVHLSTTFIRYLLDGGRVLSICSDFLNVAVPLFGTVEVQEEAVVSVTYSKWSNVQLLHHQHCFHSSSKDKRFSQNFDCKKSPNRSSVKVEPTHVEITDEYGIHHLLNLNILASDDTWGAPSLLAAKVAENKGIAVFSQVHLEQSPPAGSFEGPMKHVAESDQSRMEILQDLLSTHLSIDTTQAKVQPYTTAYLLGRHELKQSLLTDLHTHMKDQELKRSKLIMHFLPPGVVPKQASENYMPILLNACPQTFSTVMYYETLRTHEIGRLAIYCDLMTSSMNVTAGYPHLVHGFVVLPTQQTQGKGRGGNSWLSPMGCLMFTVQLHISLTSILGQHISIMQHLASLAIVMAVREQPGYADVPMQLKWPNDLYINDEVKIGGVFVEATTMGKKIVLNIGVGINLSNTSPTTCINDQIRLMNKEMGSSMEELDREVYLAEIFNCLEKLIDSFQKDGPQAVLPYYYKYWLHNNSRVTVQGEDRHQEAATIIGIDDFGFLVARLDSGHPISLQPDGNSFNMMEGLIYSKLQ